MDKKVEKFKTDYTAIKAQVADFKKKLRDLKKEIKPVAKAAYRLYERGEMTMYDEGKGGVIMPKFYGVSRMIEDLECWMDLDGEIQHTIENF